jgi:hypothetical protein
MASLRIPALARKPVYAKHVARFVNRATRLPGFRPLAIGSLAAIVLTTLVGAFGTGAIPAGPRLLFWTALIGTNAVLWQAWFAWMVRRPSDWLKAGLVGAVLINAPLPFEIAFFLRHCGVEQAADPTTSWVKALAISAVIVGLSVALRVRNEHKRSEPAIRPGGLLAKAGVVAPDDLLALRAEDHYCRAFLAEGRSVLVHHRFADALDEVAQLDGAQVHRSVWVANRGIKAAIRNGRSWRLILPDGTALPVSAKCTAEVRARGWLNRK